MQANENKFTNLGPAGHDARTNLLTDAATYDNSPQIRRETWLLAQIMLHQDIRKACPRA
jgi:hypothetical protein